MTKEEAYARIAEHLREIRDIMLAYSPEDPMLCMSVGATGNIMAYNRNWDPETKHPVDLFLRWKEDQHAEDEAVREVQAEGAARNYELQPVFVSASLDACEKYKEDCR